MFYTYIVMNPRRTTIYIGVTNNLRVRLAEHYMDRGSKNHFASRYYCYELVHFESFTYILDAINREKQLKGWRRSKKIDLIQLNNPAMKKLVPP